MSVDYGWKWVGLESKTKKLAGAERVWLFHPLSEAPTDGNKNGYQWLECSNIIGPSIPKSDGFIRNLNLYFFFLQLPSTTATDPLLVAQPINQAFKNPQIYINGFARQKERCVK